MKTYFYLFFDEIYRKNLLFVFFSAIIVLMFVKELTLRNFLYVKVYDFKLKNEYKKNTYAFFICVSFYH